MAKSRDKQLTANDKTQPVICLSIKSAGNMQNAFCPTRFRNMLHVASCWMKAESGVTEQTAAAAAFGGNEEVVFCGWLWQMASVWLWLWRVRFHRDSLWLFSFRGCKAIARCDRPNVWQAEIADWSHNFKYYWAITLAYKPNCRKRSVIALHLNLNKGYAEKCYFTLFLTMPRFYFD